LVKACTSRIGESPTMAASHGRRPASASTPRVTSSAQIDSSSAVTMV
jgi:hypothetical protein